MRILVTGSSGFVGQHVTAFLREQGDEVIAWGLGHSDDGSSTSVDLRDPEAVKSQDLKSLDAVIHLAGLALVRASFSEPASFICQNSEIQINLFEGLLDQDVRPRVLLVSTGAVYGSSDVEITEQSPTDPTSPYAVSKLTQELIGSYYTKRGFDVITARPFNHFGPGQQRGYLVADIASQIAEAERRGHGRITLGDLSSRRDWTDVRDIAAAYSSLLRTGRTGEIYNVCSGVSLSGAEILEQLLALTSADIEVETAAALGRPTDTSVVSASNEKIHRETGWSPTVPLEVTLRETLDHWRS